MRLLSASLDQWNAWNGWCLSRGIKPLKLSPADYQDLVLFWLTDGAEEKSIVDFERKLTMPPPGTKVKANDPVWSRDAEMAAFRSAAKK